MNKIYNRYNFHKHTFCVFTEVSFDAISDVKPNYISKSGSSYFFMEDGVYRLSNHWGRAANCKWRLQNSAVSAQRTKLGFAKWSEFHPDNDTEKLYFIEVDYASNTVNYQHKSNSSNENTIFRTAAETEKIIKQIRILLTTENWSKHYDLEINILRKKIIHGLIHTSKTLQQIKSELLNQLAE